MSDAISIPHVDDEPGSYNAAVKRGYDMMRADFNANAITSVHEANDLKKKRSETGYFAEDGTNKAHGVDDTDLYGPAWTEDFLLRKRLLDANRFYQFAVMVSTGANLPLQDFTNEANLQRSVVERIRQTRERLAEAEKERAQQESTAPEVDSQQARYDAAVSAVQKTEKTIDELVTSAAEFVAKGRNRELKTDMARLENPQTEFDIFVTNAIYKYGNGGFKSASEELQNFAVQVGSGSVSDEIKGSVPLSSNAALFLSFLEHCVKDASLVLMLGQANSIHAANSFYAQNPLEYARDVFQLSQLVTSEFGLFEQTSLGFYDHLKTMAENSGFDVSSFVCPPQAPVDRKKFKKGKSTVVLDVGDDEVPTDSCNSGRLYTLQELERERKKVVLNNVPEQTRSIFNKVLTPMFTMWAPHIFFSTDAPFVELSVFMQRKIGGDLLFDLIVRSTRKTLKAENAPKITPIVTERQKKRYTRDLMQYAVISSGVLHAAARFIVARKAGNLQTFLPVDQENALAAYLVASTPESEQRAYNAFSLLFSERPDSYPLTFLTEPSHLKFYGLAVNQNAALLNEKKEQQEKVVTLQKAILEERIKARQTFLEKNKADAQSQTLSDALAENYVPTLGVALSPQNSGLLFFSVLMIGGLQEAERLLRQYVPCIANHFETMDAMIESDYWQQLATLVRANVRYSEARNPTKYAAVVEKELARQGTLSSIQEMRRLALADSRVTHGKTCQCRPAKKTTVADLLRVVQNY
jgi:hypothetical protein